MIRFKLKQKKIGLQNRFSSFSCGRAVMVIICIQGHWRPQFN